VNEVGIGESDAKWQLAEELGHLEQMRREIERLLFILTRDKNEYVRRRSLQSLARLGCSEVEKLALAECHRPDDAHGSECVFQALVRIDTLRRFHCSCRTNYNKFCCLRNSHSVERRPMASTNSAK
jgi:hypothetical protein